MSRPNQSTIKLFEDLYQLEKTAKDLYDEYLKDLKDQKAIKVVKEIRNDELRHMKIAQQLLDLIKKNEN